MRNSTSANTLFLRGIVALCKILNAVTENKTVLMIAHRMKFIPKADKIIATEKGVIKQEEHMMS